MGSNSNVVVVEPRSPVVASPAHSITIRRGGSASRTVTGKSSKSLERAELVTGRRLGRERHLALAPLPIKRIHDRWISDDTRAAVDLLERLDGAG